MNNFFDSNASYVDLLIDKYNPPSNPKCVVDYDVKGIVESRLGVCLPEDYYEDRLSSQVQQNQRKNL
jgi:hypothetical protein